MGRDRPLLGDRGILAKLLHNAPDESGASADRADIRGGAYCYSNLSFGWRLVQAGVTLSIKQLILRQEVALMPIKIEFYLVISYMLFMSHVLYNNESCGFLAPLLTRSFPRAA